MLIELFCEKFGSCNSKANPIRFGENLNVIRGGEEGDNSVGKSTFMQILDFTFGGEAFEKNELKNTLGDVTIFFAFKFEDSIYRFSRSIENSSKVSEYSDVYVTAKEVSIIEFRNFLLIKYRLGTHAKDFRSLVGCLTKMVTDVDPFADPLRSVQVESEEDGIIHFLKLFGEYKPLEEMKRTNDSNNKSKSAYDAAAKKNFVVKATKKEQKSLIKEIESLQEELDDIESGFLSSLYAEKIDATTDLKYSLDSLFLIRAKMKSELKILKKNAMDGVNANKSDYSELLQFFPGVNIRNIEEVDRFHEGLKEVLKAEIDEEIQDVKTKLALINEAISCEKEKVEKVERLSRIEPLVLKKYADIKSSLDAKQSAKKQIDEILQLKETCKRFESKYNERLLEIVKPLVETVNAEIAVMNDTFEILKGSPSPVLTVKSSKKYDFKTPGDDGSGTRSKGILLFHLAMLKLSSAPFLIHDTFDLNQAQHTTIAGLVKLGNASTKQVFLAIDKIASIADNEFKRIIDEKTVLKLDFNHKLFAGT